MLLLAKENKVAKKFTSFFKDRKIIKTYLAIVSPCPNDDGGTIDLPLSKSGTKDFQRMSVDQNMGKRAITDYKVLDKVGSRVALVALYPKTGRTHQLRVQCAKRKIPIIGDKTYGDFSANRKIEKQYKLDRLCLHASEIYLEIKLENGDLKKLHYESPLPRAMGRIIH